LNDVNERFEEGQQRLMLHVQTFFSTLPAVKIFQQRTSDNQLLLETQGVRSLQEIWSKLGELQRREHGGDIADIKEFQFKFSPTQDQGQIAKTLIQTVQDKCASTGKHLNSFVTNFMQDGLSTLILLEERGDALEVGVTRSVAKGDLDMSDIESAFARTKYPALEIQISMQDLLKDFFGVSAEHVVCLELWRPGW